MTLSLLHMNFIAYLLAVQATFSAHSFSKHLRRAFHMLTTVIANILAVDVMNNTTNEKKSHYLLSMYQQAKNALSALRAWSLIHAAVSSLCYSNSSVTLQPLTVQVRLESKFGLAPELALFYFPASQEANDLIESLFPSPLYILSFGEFQGPQFFFLNALS